MKVSINHILTVSMSGLTSECLIYDDGYAPILIML